MQVVLKIFGGLVGLVVAVVAITLVYARFHDGPVSIIAGGPFASGELHTGPEPDWSPMRTRQEVEFQLLDPPRSRITWVAEHEGKPYIVSGYMNSTFGKIWKQWPHEIEKDDRILLRVDDVIYERRLVRIMEGPMVAPVIRQLSEKYLDGASFGDPDEAVRNGDVWFYEVAPR
ncbi:MAG: hypothetical protein QF570_07935 [Myxococcota bacterium]|jgi:hypothetical protein|nr:hypothetical protein [Myxococcota bacterium]